LQIRETVLGKDIEIGTFTISKCKSGRNEDIHDLISALSNPEVKQWVLLIFQKSIDGFPRLFFNEIRIALPRTILAALMEA
jgi:hypothetical protein